MAWWVLFFCCFFLFDDPCQKFTVPEANTNPLTWKASAHMAVWAVLKCTLSTASVDSGVSAWVEVHLKTPKCRETLVVGQRTQTGHKLHVCNYDSWHNCMWCCMSTVNTHFELEKKSMFMWEVLGLWCVFCEIFWLGLRGRDLTFFLGYLLFWNSHVVKPHWQNKNPFCCYCCLGLHFRVIYHFMGVTGIEKDEFIYFLLFFMIISFSVCVCRHVCTRISRNNGGWLKGWV